MNQPMILFIVLIVLVGSHFGFYKWGQHKEKIKQIELQAEFIRQAHKQINEYLKANDELQESNKILRAKIKNIFDGRNADLTNIVQILDGIAPKSSPTGSDKTSP